MQCPGSVVDRVLFAYFYELCVLMGELNLPLLLNSSADLRLPSSHSHSGNSCAYTFNHFFFPLTCFSARLLNVHLGSFQMQPNVSNDSHAWTGAKHYLDLIFFFIPLNLFLYSVSVCFSICFPLERKSEHSSNIPHFPFSLCFTAFIIFSRKKPSICLWQRTELHQCVTGSTQTYKVTLNIYYLQAQQTLKQ